MNIVLRDHQLKINDALRSSFAAGHRNVLLVSPTGSGKTVTFTFAARAAARKGGKVIILVHRRSLVKQASRTLDTFGVAHGIIAAGVTPDFSQAVQVASVQTLAVRLGKIPPHWVPSFVIVDEAHHATPTTTWGRVMTHFAEQEKPAHILGVTATPERLDGQGLGRTVGGLFDVMVMGPTVRELVDAGYLVRPVLYAPPMLADLSHVRTTGGEDNKKDAAEALDRAVITGDAVTHYKRICPHTPPAIAFCTTVAHAEHVAEGFRAAGFRAAAIHGKLKQDEQDSLIAGLGTGRYQLLASCELVSEGTDIPAMEVAILLRPTQSLAMFLQQVGRALRPAPGKKRAVILDHVGSWTRHGLPDEDREWDLGAAKRKKKKKDDDDELSTRQCTECYTVHEYGPECPACGHVYPKKERRLEVVDGDLEQITPERAAQLKTAGQRAAKSLDELKLIGKMRGYKPQWAGYVWKARQAAVERRAAESAAEALSG